jgi:hypothetical protein
VAGAAGATVAGAGTGATVVAAAGATVAGATGVAVVVATVGVAVVVATVGVAVEPDAKPQVAVVAVSAAFAGTTDKSPNPSEATATAETFFNEIVFTIFLSFSQIKDDLLSGW